MVIIDLENNTNGKSFRVLFYTIPQDLQNMGNVPSGKFCHILVAWVLPVELEEHCSYHILHYEYQNDFSVGASVLFGS